MKQKKIMHFIKPTKYHQEPYGTIWFLQDKDEQVVNIFVQVKTGEPCWVPLGDILSKVFEPCIDVETFIPICLEIYNGKAPKNKAFNMLSI